MRSCFQVVIVAMTTQSFKEVLLYLFLRRVLKMWLSKAVLFLGQLCWIKSAATVATRNFMSFLPKKSLTASQGVSPK